MMWLLLGSFYATEYSKFISSEPEVQDDDYEIEISFDLGDNASISIDAQTEWND